MEFSMADFNATFQKTLDILLEEKKYSSAKDILSTMAPEDVAAVLQELDEKPAALLFRLLPKKIAAEAFVEMESDFQEKLIKGFSDKELTAILDEMYVNDAADIVEEMPANVQMGASVSEGRLVGKEDARHCFAALDLDLDKAHQAVPYAVGATSAKADFTILSLKHIGLLGKARIQAQQHIGIAAVAHALPLSGAVFEREAAKAFQQL